MRVLIVLFLRPMTMRDRCQRGGDGVRFWEVPVAISLGNKVTLREPPLTLTLSPPMRGEGTGISFSPLSPLGGERVRVRGELRMTVLRRALLLLRSMTRRRPAVRR